MKYYRFSPIKNKDKLIEAVKYVAAQNTRLCKKVTGKTLPMTSVTIFSHYKNEYERLTKILTKIGDYHGENNGLRVTLHKPVKASGHTITHLRVRQPDPYRMQVGCGDFTVKDYQMFKSDYLDTHKENLRLITRSEYEMIEFFDPDFDVLAYVVSR